MTLYELLDLNLSTGGRIDVQISIFITVHLAIFGAIIYVDRPLRCNEKVASLIIYSIFAVLNYGIMKIQLNLSLSLVSEIAALRSNPCCIDNATVKYIADQFNSGSYVLKEILLITGHLAFYIMVLLSILFDKALSNLGAFSGTPQVCQNSH